MSLTVIFGSLLSVVSSQCYWTVTNPENGLPVTLNLTALQGITLEYLEDNEVEIGPQNAYNYTICANKEICYDDGEYMMVNQFSGGYYFPIDCFMVGRWDNTIKPVFENINGGTWTFVYDNVGTRTWSPKFVCAPDVMYQAGIINEVPVYSCFYELEIRTQFACPEQPCIFKSENGNHSLNLTSIKGQLLSQADSETAYLYYMYTPCANEKCTDDTSVMAYIFDGMNFECKQTLAIWGDGYVEANYTEGIGMWQFTHTNGQSCN
eukprot:108254_1